MTVNETPAAGVTLAIDRAEKREKIIMRTALKKLLR